jgi:hypothetical protein
MTSNLTYTHQYSLYERVNSKNHKGERVQGWNLLGVAKGTTATGVSTVANKQTQTEISKELTNSKNNIRLDPKTSLKLVEGMLIQENFGLKRSFLVMSIHAQYRPATVENLWYIRLEVEQESTLNYNFL